MHNRLMGTIENLEEKIEQIKWLIVTPFSVKRKTAPLAGNIIRKTSGILGKTSPKGTVVENRLRKAWKTNALGRER